ncbi:dGTP triphosphohydrolase [Haliscomenobacter hydrossis]|uniref:Deoxyguanosinetriphosphate triphosphohydrolase n=1 Tax=Haliscomenobacter hydrossis (strain ATCC 27775 / DSM 1100 / LMG 10767 / O) TaxID=760192 RepID=F4L863_HALH1|nr:dNTP triphosphohydrolase [Haliscomenobacter hydrossis]AEE54571.1 deoxyguanosinetriphosphate triphosphohydrolase [Haliscomenobacter hydrossis DSM 1100]
MQDMMTWNNCFSPKRYGVDDSPKGIRTEFERDWDRIIFSSPFRRLQNKTQVFPLPKEVFVHNRLTHSLEVSSVGRSLGKIVGERLCELELDEDAKQFYQNDLKNVIAAACLAHDMGNPAFGHSGEEAISKYFKERDTKKPEDLEFKGLFTPGEWRDLITFEGNANALRIITMNQRSRFPGGFRLTYSTIGSIIKYPCESLGSEGSKGSKHRKKYGYFKIDEEVFLDVANELKMIRENVESRVVYKRHPFVYLVEAADDICYNIIDFEDAHRLGLLPFEVVKNMFIDIIVKDPETKMDDLKFKMSILEEDNNETIAYLRSKAINVLTKECAEKFWEDKDKILSGNYNTALMDDLPEFRSTLKKIEDASIKSIYNARGVVELEIAGFRIMSGLVKDFVTSALVSKDRRDKEQQKIMELLPNQFRFDETSSPYIKVMHILDFISGMTDLFALKLYRKLRGIEI